MATTITTISVSPERAERLRQFRDDRDCPNLDAALDELLSERGE